jgi:hypothetical protein
MANLLKPSVDQTVFAHSPVAQPARCRPERIHNVSFLAQDEEREPIAIRVAGILRAVSTSAVLAAGFAVTGQV